MSESIEQIETESLVPARRQKDRRDGNKDMDNLLFILDRRKAIAAYHAEQNNALRDELKILRAGKHTWFELAIASWLVTLAMVIGMLVSKL